LTWKSQINFSDENLYETYNKLNEAVND